MNARPRAKSWLWGPLNTQCNYVGFTCPCLNFAEAPVKKRPKCYDLAAYTSETIGAVRRLCRPTQLDQTESSMTKHNHFATVSLHNNIFCHGLCDHLHFTAQIVHSFTYVLRKIYYTLADQNVHHFETCSQRNITQKQFESYYLTEVLQWGLYSSYTFRDL